MSQTLRAHWSGKLAFILAASGSAIGLGNIWKFPYITGVNGGGAFVLIYLVCIALVGIPIMIAELYIGQAAQRNVVCAFESLDKEKTGWRLPGVLGLISAFLILSFYSVVGGWVLNYEFETITGSLLHQDEGVIKGTLDALLGHPWIQLFWHTIFMVLTVGIVIGGVKNGLERWNKILMPLLLILLCGLLVYVLTLDGFSKAVNFLFSMDVSKLTSGGILEAVGHSFFTLSLGMGAILTYGSYLEKNEDLQRITLVVAVMDTVIALIAGLVIFSIVFSFDLEPAAGPGLIFSTLPVLFSKMPGGYFLSLTFFLLIAFAAFTSAVSILEVVTAYWEEKHKVCRKKTAVICGSAVWVVGLLSVFSYNLLADVKVFGLAFFDLFDVMTSNYFLPIGGMLISLFFGWKLGPTVCEKVLGTSKSIRFYLLLWSTRVVAPIAVLVVLIQKIVS